MSTARKIILGIAVALVAAAAYFNLKPNVSSSVKKNPSSLYIESLRNRQYPGSEIKIEETLAPEKTYNRHIVSYYSDGLKLNALLLIPNTSRPKEGFPVIILNHGYVIPGKYTPEGNYIPYLDSFARAGYIVFKPNYRGHGESEGRATSAYFSSDYVVDVLNGISSIKKYPGVNPEKIGVWGHSMGGNISLKVAEISGDVKALDIWSGVVAPIDDIIYNWQGRVSYIPDPLDLELRNKGLNFLIQKYGSPSKNPKFWDKIDPNTYLSSINIPVQISVGLSDNQVPTDFSKGLYERLRNLNKEVFYYEYPGANHDINQSFTGAMERTIKFFDMYLR